MSIIDDIRAATAQLVDAYPSDVTVTWEGGSRDIRAAAHSRSRGDGFDVMGSRTIADVIVVTCNGSDFTDAEVLLINQDARLTTGGITYKVEGMTRTAQNATISITGNRL